MSSYLTVFPGILIVFSIFMSPRIFYKILKTYTIVILGFATFLNILDLGLYPHWGTRVGISAFDYIGDPKGMFANITIVDLIVAMVVSSGYLVLFIWLFKRFFKISNERLSFRQWFIIPVFLFLTAGLILPIRGGLGTSPINQSTVAFSNKLYANQSASNYLWNFFNTIERRKIMTNPCIYTSNDIALQVFQENENKRTHSDSVFISPNEKVQPNVLLIILESFSDKVISSFGGKYNVCPNLDSICAESVIFPSFYASGNRSDRGISAILASYPSLLGTSIIRFPYKSEKLTMISDYFNRKNYYSSFYYGGDINFYDMKSIVLQGNYNRVTGQNEFPEELQNLSNWGVPDQYLFDRVFNDIQQQELPFFTVAYTLSSHPPYDVPVQIVKGQSNEAKYLNSVAYTDSCIGNFIREFKKTKYWENTLVIITADHGALEPGPTEIIEPATYRIPLIWTGGIVEKPGVVNHIGGQPDLGPTLVHQLGWETDSVLFGHDLFSLPSYAFYMSNQGWGYITNEGEYFYDLNAKDFITFEQKENATPNFSFAKAYLQVLHNDFLMK